MGILGGYFHFLKSSTRLKRFRFGQSICIFEVVLYVTLRLEENKNKPETSNLNKIGNVRRYSKLEFVRNH